MELTIIGNFMNKIFIIRFSKMVLGDGVYIELNKSFFPSRRICNPTAMSIRICNP